MVDAFDSMKKAEHLVSLETSLYIILNIYKVSGDRFWAVTERLTPTDNDCQFTFRRSTKDIQVFQTTDTVKNVHLFINVPSRMAVQLALRGNSVLFHNIPWCVP